MPPVAMPGFPASMTAVNSPGAATSVPAPLSTTVHSKRPASSSTAAKRSSWTWPCPRPAIAPLRPDAESGSPVADDADVRPAESPSASRIIGLPEPMAASNRAFPHSPRPSPGPTARTSARAISGHNASASSTAWVIASGRAITRAATPRAWPRWPIRLPPATPLPRTAVPRRSCQHRRRCKARDRSRPCAHWHGAAPGHRPVRRGDRRPAGGVTGEVSGSCSRSSSTSPQKSRAAPV